MAEELTLLERLDFRGVSAAAGMAALAHDLGGALGGLAVGTAEVFSLWRDAATGGITALLDIAHRSSFG